MSKSTLLGNGQLGYLYLTVGDAEYTRVSGGTVFIPPVHPGLNPNIPVGATTAQITEANRVHAADIKATNTYNSMEAAMKAFIIAAAPDIYLKSLKDNAYGYAQVTALQLITHLLTTYGIITRMDLADNKVTMNTDWNTHDPTETLWAQLDDGQAFAAGNDDISNITKMEFGLNIIKRTGVFTEPLQRWHRQPMAEQTYANLQTFFNQANTERLTNTTTTTAGYHGANLANTVPEGADLIYYCWTHGGGTDPGHTSKTCTRPNTNHNRSATAGNMLGGKNTLKRRPGEKAIHVPPSRPPTRTTAAAAP
jgi:hypothetical protein